MSERQPSIRLTNDMRDSIIRAAVKARFDKDIEARAKIEDKIGRKFYAAVISEAERRAIAKLPERWWREDQCLRFNVGGWALNFALIGKPVRVPKSSNCNTLGAISDPELVKEGQAHAESLKEDGRIRDEARRTLKGLVYSVSTVGALRTIWPEGAPFYSTIQAPPATQVAPIVANINAMFGLTKVGEAA